MADLEVVAMLDNAAGCFGRPGFYPARGVAVRAFADEVNKVAPDNALNNHPQDFSLWSLGVFDDLTGVFSGPKEKLADAVTLLVRE